MEGFFQKSLSIDEIAVEELLLRRYSNIEYLLKKDYEYGFEFVTKAFEKERDDYLWQQWLVDYRRMDKDNFISFAEYKEEFTKVNPDENLSFEEIEEKVKKIIGMTL